VSNSILSTTVGTNRSSFNTKDWALFVSLSAIWGSSFLFMAIGLDNFHPGVVTMLRVMFGAAFMFALPRSRRISIPREEWPRIVATSVSWIIIPFTLFPLAQQWIDSGVAGMLNGATPLFTAVVASFMLQQLPGPRQFIGLLVGFVGVVAIAVPSAQSGSTAAVGVVMVLIATIGYALATNIVAPLQQRYGAIPVMARVQWVATLGVIPFGLWGVTQSTFAVSSFLAVMAVGVLGTGLAFVLMGDLIGSVGPTRATVITYLIPVVALILGVAFRSEQISSIAVAGVVLVIAGAFLASRREI
jgi:drug/metabolite transporter (DMT)-like permease